MENNSTTGTNTLSVQPEGTITVRLEEVRSDDIIFVRSRVVSSVHPDDVLIISSKWTIPTRFIV